MSSDDNTNVRGDAVTKDNILRSTTVDVRLDADSKLVQYIILAGDNIYWYAIKVFAVSLFRLDVLAWSVIAAAPWLADWVAGTWLAGCHTPLLYQNR